MTLREIKNGTKFRLRKNGAIWIKLNEQGMNNNVTYCRSESQSNTRCQRLSYKHKYLHTDTVVYEILD